MKVLGTVLGFLNIMLTVATINSTVILSIEQTKVPYFSWRL